MRNENTIKVIGVGNLDCADDGVGVLAAKFLEDEFSEEIEVIAHSGEAASLMELWQRAGLVIVIDATHSNREAGTISRYDVTTSELPSDLRHFSSHSFGVHDAVELSRTLDQMPSKLIVFGIEGACFKVGTPISEEVQAAIKVIPKTIREEISEFTREEDRDV